MPIFSAFLFAFCVNIDTLLIGFSYGLKKQQISLAQNLFISGITFFGTVISIFCGMGVASFLPSAHANRAGGLLLFILGLYYLLKYLFYDRKKLPPNALAAECTPIRLSVKESMLLGIVLSLNNMGMGIGAGLSGMNLTLACVLTLVLSILFLFLGSLLGKKSCPQKLCEFAAPISGGIIAVLGVWQAIG
ncbi:hypothetical protein FACS1894111_08900 [Clostridia bacterium]|nr:hypothetical protein FACS1894111_08900 [Clostridia bacterium]